MPHAVVRWSAVQGGSVGCCVVWPGGGEVPCGVACGAARGGVVGWRGGVLREGVWAPCAG